MPATVKELNALIERLALVIPDLNLDGDEQEENSTMLLRLQNTVETDEPNQRIVFECLAYFESMATRAASHLQWLPRAQIGNFLWSRVAFGFDYPNPFDCLRVHTAEVTGCRSIDDHISDITSVVMKGARQTGVQVVV